MRLRRPQHGHGPVADIIVERGQRGGDDPLAFVPGAAGLENRLADPADHQRPPKLTVSLMEQQVAVKPR